MLSQLRIDMVRRLVDSKTALLKITPVAEFSNRMQSARARLFVPLRFAPRVCSRCICAGGPATSLELKFYVLAPPRQVDGPKFRHHFDSKLVVLSSLKVKLTETKFVVFRDD